MPTIDVPDFDGVRRQVGAYTPGTKAAADSAPVTLSTEERAALANLAALPDLLDLVQATDPQLPDTLGQKTAAQSLSVVPARVTALFLERSTSTTGSNFLAFASSVCREVILMNTRPGAPDIEVRRGSAGPTVCLPGGAAMPLAVQNANEIQVRRYDQSNTPWTVDCEVRA